MKKFLRVLLILIFVLVIFCVALYAAEPDRFMEQIDIIESMITGNPVRDRRYDFDLEINDETMGTVTVDAKDPEPGTVMNLKAKPNYGYVFLGWYVGDECVSKDAEFTYIMPKKSVTMMGIFAKDKFDVKVTSMHPGFTANLSGRYDYLSTVSVTAHEIEGTRFVGWYSDGKLLSTDMALTFSVGSDVTVYAEYYVPGTIEVYSWPKASAAAIGTPLSEVELIGGSANVLGYFKWANPDEPVYNGGEYIVTFVPFVTSATEFETMIAVPIASVVLSAPSFTIEDGVVVWNAVSGAAGYQVKVNEDAYSLDLSEYSYTLPTEMGEYYVSVEALGDGVSTVTSSDSAIERYVPKKPTSQELGFGQGKSEYDQNGEMVKFAGTVKAKEGVADIVEGSVVVKDDYIIFQIEVDVSEYLTKATKQKVLELNKFNIKDETKIVIKAEVVIYDPTFYAELDLGFPHIMEDLEFGISYKTMTTSILEIDVNGEFVEPEQRRGTLHLLFIDLVGLEEPLYKWCKVEIPIYGKTVTAELALCFDAVGAIGASLYVKNVETANYEAGVVAIKNGVPLFAPHYDRNMTSNLTEIDLAGELDFNVNCARLSASLKINKGDESISIVRLNLDYFNIESDLSGEIKGELNVGDDIEDTSVEVSADTDGSYRIYGQVTFEYYFEIRLNFIFLPLDEFKIKVMDGSYVLMEWEIMKGGIPKTPYMDEAIHITTPIYATDNTYDYFIETDKDLVSILTGEGYAMAEHKATFDSEEIVGIDNYYVYVLAGNKIRRVGRTAGTERTIAMGVNYVVHSDRNYIYYTTTAEKNAIVKLYRSDVGEAHAAFVRLPQGYEAVSMRYDNLLDCYVIYALNGSSEWFFTYDGVNLVRRGINEHKYWQKLSLGEDTVAYYRLDKNGIVKECFIRTPSGGVTHADSALSIGISELGLFVVTEKEGKTYNYELGLYPIGKESRSYVKIAEVSDPTVANRIADDGGYAYFVDMNASAFMIYKTDGKSTHPVAISAYGETLGTDSVKAEIHGDWLFVYKYSRGSVEVLYTVDLLTLEIAPYLTNGNHFEFDKASGEILDIALSGNATVLGLYISALTDEEYAALKKGYEDMKENWEKVDKFMTRYADFWKKKEVSSDDIIEYIESYSELFRKAAVVVSAVDYAAGDLSHGEFPLVNLNSSITVYNDTLLGYSYGLHTAYLITTSGILPVTIEVTDSRSLTVNQETTPDFDKGAPEHIKVEIGLYDSGATLDIPADAYGKTERLDANLNPTGVYDFVFYSSYLATLPYGENKITLTDKNGDKVDVRINVMDTRSPADGKYSKYYDLSYSEDVRFTFDTFDEKYITKVEGNNIPSIGAYEISPYGGAITFSRNYLTTLLPGTYYYTVTTSEKTFEISVVVIETVAPKATSPDEFNLANGGYLEIGFEKNDAAIFDLYFDSKLVPEEYWYYSMVDGKIYVDAVYLERYVPYGELDITIRSVIYSGDKAKSHTLKLTTDVTDTRTPTVSVTEIIHTVLDTTPAIAIKVALYGQRVTEVTVLDTGMMLGYKMLMSDSDGNATFRDGYLVIPANYVVDQITEGEHTIRISIGELVYDVELTLVDERLPRATSGSAAYDVDAPASADYVIRLFGEQFLSLSLGGVVLPEDAYTFTVHNVNELYHIIVINREYLETLGLTYSSVVEFTVQTSVNSFSLYVRANPAPSQGGGGSSSNPGGGGGYDGPNGGSPSYTYPEYNPASQLSAYPSSFSVDVVDIPDIVFSVNYGSNNYFGSLKHGFKTLTKGVDYTINEQGEIVIFASYFASLSGYEPYTFTVNGGKGRSTTVTVSFYDSRDPYTDEELSASYDKYEDNKLVFSANVFDSKVSYVKLGSQYFYSGFSNTSYAITLNNALLDSMPFGQNVIVIGFNDSSATITVSLDTHDTTLYYTKNTSVDKAIYAVEDGTIFIPYSLYEGSVSAVSANELEIVSFDDTGVTLTGFKNASYGKHDVTVIANGHKFVINVTVHDTRKPTTTDEDGIYVFDKGSFEYTLDPVKASQYDLYIELMLYDNTISGYDALGKQTIWGNNLEYEDYTRVLNNYLLSYFYLYRLPDGEYTFYISTTDGNIEFKVIVTDSRAPYLNDEDPKSYDYEAAGDHSVGAHLYSDEIASLSYIDIITGNVMLLSKSDYTVTAAGEGDFTVTIKRAVFERGDFYNGYTYKFTLATNTERTLSFNVVIENGPERPFYVTYYSVPWNGSEPEILIESEIIYENGYITVPETPSHEYYNFLGFYTERTGGKIFDFSKPVTDDVNIFLHWEPKTYNVTLVSDGEVLKTIPVQYLSKIPELTVPTKTGYTFIKWTTEDGLRFNLSGKTMPHEDITVYAEWQINSYTVIFKHYNGTVLKEETVYAFENATAPEMPEIDYYVFKGWDKFYTGVLSDLVVNAIYTPIKYDITYELNGGENPASAPAQYTFEGGVKLPSPTMAGHLFMGWYLDESLEGTRLYEIPYGTTPGLTLYAKWQAVHTVTFDTAGGAYMADYYVPVGSTVTLPKAERGGCTFLGWYDESGSRIPDTITPSGDITVHAKWERVVVKYENDADRIVTDAGHYGLSQTTVFDQIDISALSDFLDSRYVVKFRVVLTMADTVAGTDHIILYNATNGEIINPGSESKMTESYAKGQGMVYSYQFSYGKGSTVSDKLIEFTIPGEKCGDYMTFRYDANGDRSEIWNIYNITVEVSIVDSANTFPINYVMNGGTNPVGAPTTYTVSGSVDLPTPTRAGYVFAGWYTNEKFSGKAVTAVPAEAPQGFTVYAKWIPGVYKVSFSAQHNGADIPLDGVASTTVASVVYGSDFWLPTPEFTKGIIFLGWYSGQGGTGTQITDASGKSVSGTVVSADMTVYAKFESVMNTNFIEITETSFGFILKPNSIVECDVRSVELYLDGELVDSLELTDNHYYRFTELTEGLEYEIRVGYTYKHRDQGFTVADEYSIKKVTVYTPGSFLLSDVLAGAVEYNGHYYKLVSYSKDWYTCNQYAINNGGYLVTLSSAAENAFVYSYIWSMGVNDAYFGLLDDGTEGNWRWANGERVVFTNWHSGEPNGGTRENFGHYYSGFSGSNTWNDTGNGTSSYFIIEWGLY